MTEADVFDRLEDMGYGPESDLSRLRYALLPSLPPLDTITGADALMALLDAVQAEWPAHHLVVIMDTIGRAVCGEENSADTFRAFYNFTGIELKRRGLTWMRLDHGGKDSDRGQRGSSSKGDDVDVVWKLKPTENGVSLQRDVARMSWVPEQRHLRAVRGSARATSGWPRTGRPAPAKWRTSLTASRCRSTCPPVRPSAPCARSTRAAAGCSSSPPSGGARRRPMAAELVPGTTSRNHREPLGERFPEPPHAQHPGKCCFAGTEPLPGTTGNHFRGRGGNPEAPLRGLRFPAPAPQEPKEP